MAEGIVNKYAMERHVMTCRSQSVEKPSLLLMCRLGFSAILLARAIKNFTVLGWKFMA